MSIKLPRIGYGDLDGLFSLVNKLAALAETSRNLRSDGSIRVEVIPGATMIMAIPPDAYPVKIISGSQPYSWMLVEPNSFANSGTQPKGWNGITPPFSGNAADFTGVSTGGNTSTTLNDTTQNWTVNQWAGQNVTITSGTGAVEKATVVSNTAMQLVIEGTWAVTPDNTSHYDFPKWRPAYEATGNTEVPAGTIVWIVPHVRNGDATDQEYRFWYCCELPCISFSSEPGMMACKKRNVKCMEFSGDPCLEACIVNCDFATGVMIGTASAHGGTASMEVWTSDWSVDAGYAITVTNGWSSDVDATKKAAARKGCDGVWYIIAADC